MSTHTFTLGWDGENKGFFKNYQTDRHLTVQSIFSKAVCMYAFAFLRILTVLISR